MVLDLLGEMLLISPALLCSLVGPLGPGANLLRHFFGRLSDLREPSGIRLCNLVDGRFGLKLRIISPLPKP
jgi:hypothetical protein